jgi:hypothetical protein
MYDELRRMQKKMRVVYFKVLFSHFPGRNVEKYFKKKLNPITEFYIQLCVCVCT